MKRKTKTPLAAAAPPQPAPPPPPPTTEAGKKLAERIAKEDAALEQAKQQVTAGQEHVQRWTEQAIARTARLQMLREMLAEAEGDHAVAPPLPVVVPTPTRAERRRLARQAAAA